LTAAGPEGEKKRPDTYNTAVTLKNKDK